MRITEALSRFVASNTLAEAAGALPMGTFAAIDQDEHLFRRLTEHTRDLGGLTLERQREIAYHLTDSNPFAKRVIQLGRDFVVGDAGKWTIVAEDEKILDLLNTHWHDPFNRWPAKLESRVRELAMAGEQCYTAKTGPDGIVRLGYVDPGYIVAVKPDADNYEILDEVHLKKKAPGDPDRKLKVINYSMEQKRLVGASPDEEGKDKKYIGSCFFWKLNAPINATRGRSDLFALSDALDMLDRFHFNRMERAALINNFFWDVTVEGMGKEELEAFAKSQKPPRPGNVRFHNPQVKWEAVAPNLGGQDASAEGLMMQTPVLVGAGFPRHWLMGTGEDANRASAYEMSDPPMRMLNTRQLFVVGMIKLVFRYQIDEANALGKLPGVKPDDLYNYGLEVPEIAKRDVVKLSGALESMGRTLVIGIGEFMSRETAIRQYAFVSSQLGYDIDAEEEIERIAAERDAYEEEAISGLVLPPAEEVEA